MAKSIEKADDGGDNNSRQIKHRLKPLDQVLYAVDKRYQRLRSLTMSDGIFIITSRLR
uniref:Uncharacterized protein n=1 Tax=Magallana gigas TaxID=29159 RepID=K1Q9N0_MAGGI